MKHSLLTICLFSLLGSFPVAGQIIKIDSTSNWRKSFKAGLNLNQSTFSDNWKSGGVNSIGFSALLNYKANFKKGNNSWDNEVDFLFGITNTEGVGNRKSMDRIFLDTKYGRAMSKKWNAIVSANFLSQFADGFTYPKDSLGRTQDVLISAFMAPAFITAALGFEYHPTNYFKLRLSPLAPRVTILNEPSRFVKPDDPTPYGVIPPDDTRFEWLAAQILAEFDKDVVENINLKWRYVLFANYETLEWRRVDHRLDLSVVAKVNKYINASLTGILIYDYDQDTEAQVSQALSLGFLYTFQNYEDKK